MRALLLIVAVAGCGLSVEEVSLAQLDARARIGYQGSIYLDHGNAPDPCLVLPSTTTATMNGEPAKGEYLGGIEENRSGEYCQEPSFHWDYYVPTTGPSTFVIDDGDTAWTFVVWHPFELRTFDLVSHPSHQIRAGELVTARVAFPEDGPLQERAYVRATRDGQEVFRFDAPNGLVMEDNGLRFEMPAIGPGELKLWFESVPTPRVDRCDAPRGCVVDGRAVEELTVTVL